MQTTITAYAAVLAATLFGLTTLVSGLVSMPFVMIQGRIKPGATGIGLYVIPVCTNILMWLGIAALWGLAVGGPMPVLLFAAVFVVYGLSAKDKRLNTEGFRLAGAEQCAIVLAAVAHMAIVGIRWF